jgi:hypothetical protein
VLDDAVRRELDRRGQGARVAVHGQARVRPGVPGQQRVEVRDGGGRRQRHVAASQEADDLPHAVEGGAALALDRLEERPGALRVEVPAGVGGAGELAEALLEEPVQLVGEPRAVAGELQRDALVPQLTQLHGAGLELGAHRRAVTDRAADPGHDQQDGEGQHEGLEAGGRVPDQDRRGEQRGETQHDPCLPALQGHRAEIGEHERQRQAGATPGHPPEDEDVEHHRRQRHRRHRDHAATPPQHRDRRQCEGRDHEPRVGGRLVDHRALGDGGRHAFVPEPDVLDHQPEAHRGEGSGDHPVDGTDRRGLRARAFTHPARPPQAWTCSTPSVGSAALVAERDCTRTPMP